MIVEETIFSIGFVIGGCMPVYIVVVALVHSEIDHRRPRASALWSLLWPLTLARWTLSVVSGFIYALLFDRDPE